MSRRRSAAAPTPSVGICVPVAGDAGGLAELLFSVGCLNHDPSDLQVVVAVDGPYPESLRVAAAGGAKVVSLPTNRGSYAARNAAIEQLQPSVRAVLFTDADCRVEPNWVDAHRRALQEATLSGGRIVMTTRTPPSPAEFVDKMSYLDQRGYVESGGYAATANLAVRRELFDRLRFDPSLRSGGDQLFCKQAVAQGERLVYTGDAVVLHKARTSARALLRRQLRVGRGTARLPLELQPTTLPQPRLNRWAAQVARSQGLRMGWRWESQVCVLEALSTWALVRGVRSKP